MELTFIDLHKFRNDLHIKRSSIRFLFKLPQFLLRGIADLFSNHSFSVRYLSIESNVAGS